MKKISDRVVASLSTVGALLTGGVGSRSTW